MPSLQNPWSRLPVRAPFVLQQDQEVILGFNQQAKPQHFVHLELLPEPYLGNPLAPILVLALNPGFDPEDANHHKDSTFANLSRKNLTHQVEDYPFFLLHPSLKAPGTRWWEQSFSKLLRSFPRARIAKNILCVEYFPYHSESFGANLIIPSQRYGFALVEDAIQRGALILLLPSKKLWESAVPQLRNYSNVFELQNPRNATISRNNCPDAFSLLIETLTRYSE